MYHNIKRLSDEGVHMLLQASDSDFLLLLTQFWNLRQHSHSKSTEHFTPTCRLVLYLARRSVNGTSLRLVEPSEWG